MSAGDFVINFGKHNGMTIQEIWESDSKYIQWLYDNFEPGSPIHEKVEQFLEEET